ncbi:response regulator transcription factor [Hydrogenophaga sp.]|uniref:response regulator transcription factor n=1 Tax=Hydrogenophaga sp. TaxID=1904254 RepID=UPI00286E3058|nr:response regulator transcription factor [Hydrogenophaga sp.]
MRALIVDDHSMFCDGLKLLLQTLGAASEVATCTNSEQALEQVQALHWDLVLLDWNLGEGSVGGAQLIGQIVALQPDSRVVVISADASTQRVHAAVEAGAVGFVPKEASADLLIDAIRITSHGGIYLPTSVLDRPDHRSTPQPIVQMSDPGPGPASIQEAYPRLTPRQIDVLVCAVRGQSNKLIARALGISDGTVKQHLNAVYRELGVNSRTEAVYRLAHQGLKVF